MLLLILLLSRHIKGSNEYAVKMPILSYLLDQNSPSRIIKLKIPKKRGGRRRDTKMQALSGLKTAHLLFFQPLSYLPVAHAVQTAIIQ